VRWWQIDTLREQVEAFGKLSMNELQPVAIFHSMNSSSSISSKGLGGSGPPALFVTKLRAQIITKCSLRGNLETEDG
jgi:hypothetical protein